MLAISMRGQSSARRAAGVTPAPSEKRKVARGALLCSQGRGSMACVTDVFGTGPFRTRGRLIELIWNCQNARTQS